MAVKVKSKTGKTVTLLNPSEKGKKYATELKTGVKQTNAGVKKKDEKGKPIKLNKQSKAYRAGYLDAQKDSAKCYKARQAKKGKKK